jgi:small subunit ribosomal protein S6
MECEKRMPNYESVIIARQDMSTQQVEAMTEQLTAVIAEGGGRIGKTEYWGLRNLSYRIKKNRKGHYLMLNVEAPAATLHEVQRQLRINEDVIRFQTVRTETLDEAPSVMMQTRAAREGSRSRDRDRDGGGGYRRDRDSDDGDN